MTRVGKKSSKDTQSGTEDDDQREPARQPITGYERTTSYGSFDGQAEALARKSNGHHQMSRYQIGSEVFDFGESPGVWPGPWKNRFHKISRNKAFPWLGFSEAFSQSEATLPPVCRKPTPPCEPSTKGKRVSTLKAHKGEETGFADLALGDQNLPATDIIPAKGSEKFAGRSVFSLFGLDRTPHRVHDQNTQRTDMTITHNVSPVPLQQDDTHTQHLPAWVQTEDGPRSISLTYYLEEISKVGANGAQNDAHNNV